MVFDDSGEIADVVAIRAEEKIVVQLYHCKFSRAKEAGSQIEDMYEVCGQAQKNYFLAGRPPDTFSSFAKPGGEAACKRVGSRYERGDEKELLRIQNMSFIKPISTQVYIVQPGLSKEGASAKQLSLLSITENYLMETYKLSFTVIASA